MLRATAVVLRWMGEHLVGLNGIVLLVIAVLVLRVFLAWHPLHANSAAIGRRQRETFINTVGDNRAKTQAASAENAASIIRQCVTLFVVASILVAVLTKR